MGLAAVVAVTASGVPSASVCTAAKLGGGDGHESPSDSAATSTTGTAASGRRRTSGTVSTTRPSAITKITAPGSGRNQPGTSGALHAGAPTGRVSLAMPSSSSSTKT